MAAGAGLGRTAAGGRRGSVVRQGKRRQRLRVARRAQLSGPRGAVRGLPDGGRQCPVRGRILGLPRGPFHGGSCSEASAGAARAQTSGASCRWERAAPSESAVILVGFGVACHLGVLTDLPCVGVAKNLLHVDGLVKDELHKEQIRSLQKKGDTFPLTGTSGAVLGMALRGCNNSSKPLYISVGHRICLETAVQLVKSCCKYRIPEPIRQADIRSRAYIQKQMCSPPAVVPSRLKRKERAELEEKSHSGRGDEGEDLPH
ncbi:endonuclease V isoform X5 [Lagopus muta]|uniref:endonuclease V isoform X5 n=1 Tax=Lagopus muta TaxID=64668 RepID=UPI00209F3C75|nr:endonuclease V isoform X5 [Lagopus muta]